MTIDIILSVNFRSAFERASMEGRNVHSFNGIGSNGSNYLHEEPQYQCFQDGRLFHLNINNLQIKIWTAVTNTVMNMYFNLC